MIKIESNKFDLRKFATGIPKELVELTSNYISKFEGTESLIEFIVLFGENEDEVVKSSTALGARFENLGMGFGIVSIKAKDFKKLGELKGVQYIEFPKVFTTNDIKANVASCVPQVWNNYGLTGKGVLVGFIDTGIDYMHPAFIDENGNTRIKYIYDLFNEKVYDETLINTAIKNVDPLTIVPVQDLVGHGTAVASIAAGGGKIERDNFGVAPKASIIMVKITGDGVLQSTLSTQIMRGLKFLIDKSNELGMPLAVNVSLSTNDGAHNGSSLIEKYIDTYCQINRVAVIVAAGNEGSSGHHYSANLQDEEEVFINIAEGEKRIILQVYNSTLTKLLIEIVTPSGDSTSMISINEGVSRLNVGGHKIFVYDSGPRPFDKVGEISITISTNTGTLESGQWIMRLKNRTNYEGIIDIWLPVTAQLSSQTKFLQPDPFNTLGIPATVPSVISVGSYSASALNYSYFSGRGVERIGSITKPDILAPGENIMGAISGGIFDSETGTSVAAPQVAGVCALMVEWGIVNNNDSYLFGERLKYYILMGATRDKKKTIYPSKTYGYGYLCAGKSIELLVQSKKEKENREKDIDKNNLSIKGDEIMSSDESKKEEAQEKLKEENINVEEKEYEPKVYIKNFDDTEKKKCKECDDKKSKKEKSKKKKHKENDDDVFDKEEKSSKKKKYKENDDDKNDKKDKNDKNDKFENKKIKDKKDDEEKIKDKDIGIDQNDKKSKAELAGETFYEKPIKGYKNCKAFESTTKQYYLDHGYVDFLVQYEGDLIAKVEKYNDFASAFTIDESFAIVSARVDKIQLVTMLPEVIYIDSGGVYTIEKITPTEASKAMSFQYNPYLNLTGQGTLIGIIDTGIDYLNNEFIKEDGTSNIARIWDQSQEEINPSDEVVFGVEYKKADINKALNLKAQGKDPYSTVNIKDENGHGTAIAGMIAGRGSKELSKGIAMDAEIAFVKLKPADEGFKKFYASQKYTKYQYRNTDILLGIRYLFGIAKELDKPMVIYIPLGTTLGGHDGTSVIERYIDDLSDSSGILFVTSTGNEGIGENHTSGKIGKVGDKKDIELEVGENQDSIFMTIYANAPDKLGLSVTSPSGDLFENINPKQKSGVDLNFVYEGTIMSILFIEPSELTGDQVIVITAKNLRPGIWTFGLIGEYIVHGNYDSWLLQRELLEDNTKFLTPTPNTTMTIPSTAYNIIKVASYNQNNNALVSSSGRGTTRDGRQCPLIAAGGVDAILGGPGNSKKVMSGGSVSGAVVAGCCLQLLQWGIIDENDRTMNAIKIQSYLMRGTNQRGGDKYPNDQVGYGTIDMKQLFNNMSGSAISSPKSFSDAEFNLNQITREVIDEEVEVKEKSGNEFTFRGLYIRKPEE